MDGDVFHRLLGLYRKPYFILCEGKLEPQECAWMTMKPFLQDLKRKGDAAIVIAKSMGELLAQEIQISGNNQSINYADLSKKIDKLLQQANNITNRTKSLVLEAGKSIIHDLRYGQQFDNNTLPEKLIERYMQKAYISEFDKSICHL